MDVADHVVLPPVDTALDDPLIAMVRASLAACGLDDEPQAPARFFTDASVLAGLLTVPGDDSAVPTVVLGPGEPDQCHVVDEWCSAAKVDAAVEVYTALLERWCAAG